MSKLIEIHMIQNHSPSNLNRDDLGAPKTCWFGGVLRLRISSQCLKRSIRRSTCFEDLLERDGGIRTRRLIEHLADRSVKDRAFVAEVFRACGIKRVGDKKKNAKEPDNTNILLFLPQSAINEMANALNSNTDASKVAEEFKRIVGHQAKVPDIALSGRMMELDQEGLFAELDLSVTAALSTAHSISTHEVTNEVDYFTAVDDLPGGKAATLAEGADDDEEAAKGKGAGHVDEAQFASACFYKYFCLDWDQLLRNLAGDADLAAATLGHFLIAAAKTTPSGKKNSTAPFNEPAAILVEIKDTKIPTSYANAFAEPARRMGQPPDDAADEVSLIGRSIAQFGDHVYNVRKAHDVASKLFWYTPTLWRYPLRGWKREEDGKKKKAIALLEKPACFENLGGKPGSPPGLVEAVIRAVGADWSKVRDAGKASPKET